METPEGITCGQLLSFFTNSRLMLHSRYYTHSGGLVFGGRSKHHRDVFEDMVRLFQNRPFILRKAALRPE